MKPQVFIASSREKVEVARAFQDALGSDIEATVWDQGVFLPSSYNLEALLEVLSDSDFAIFIITRDDVVRSRGRQSGSPRDNVIFELGLFIGRLGRHRSFIVVQKSAVPELRLPLDLLGLIYLTYDDERKNLDAGVATASRSIIKMIREVSGETNNNLHPNIYLYKQFIEIEGDAKEEVWIFRVGYLLEDDSFYDVVAKNLANSVKYRYFVRPDFDRRQLQDLLERFRRDPRIREDPVGLISIDELGSADIPLTFVIIDPHSTKRRGFAIIESKMREPKFWVEIARGQIAQLIAHWTKPSPSAC